MSLHIGIPQAIVVVLLLAGLGIAMARYGQTKTETYNAVNLLAPFLMLALLWWGGFFK